MEATGDTEIAEWSELEGDELSMMLDLDEVTEPPALDNIVKVAEKLLYFEVIPDDEKKSVILQQTGSCDWWNNLEPTLNVGYKKVGSLETKPRLRRTHVKCETMSGLRQAIRDLRDARAKTKLARRATKEAARDTGTWELSSALTIMLAVRGNLRVCGKFLRWSEKDMRNTDAFKVDVPLCIKPGVAVNAEGTTLTILVDDGTMLLFDEVVRVHKKYTGKQLLCGAPEEVKRDESGRVDEMSSLWDVGVIGLDSAEREEKFYASQTSIYLN